MNHSKLYDALYNAGIGDTSPQVWCDRIYPVLIEAGYVDAAANLKDWLSQGYGKGSTSGIAYKKRHNEGVFAPEQLFCNLKPKAKRPRIQVCNAAITALIDNVPYNPDRFRATVSSEGLKQGLRQFNTVDSKFHDKATMANELLDAGIKPVADKDIKKIVGLANSLITARKAGDKVKANEVANQICTVKLVAPKSISKRGNSNKAVGE